MYRVSNLVSCWCLQRKALFVNTSISMRVPEGKKRTNVQATYKKLEALSCSLLCYSVFLTDFLREWIHLNVFPCLLRSSGVRPLWFLWWSILQPDRCSRAQQTSTLPPSAATWRAVAPWWSTASTAHLWHKMKRQGLFLHYWMEYDFFLNQVIGIYLKQFHLKARSVYYSPVALQHNITIASWTITQYLLTPAYIWANSLWFHVTQCQIIGKSCIWLQYKIYKNEFWCTTMLQHDLQNKRRIAVKLITLLIYLILDQMMDLTYTRFMMKATLK